MNIVLIGYRGTGKSVVGAILARRLSMKYIGMDFAIVEKTGITIPEIVEKYGWPGFRDRETEQARELSGKDKLIIDTGGGIIERDENIEALRKNAKVFWLKAKVETIVSRIQGDNQRPSLTSGKSFTDEVEEVLERRTPKYKAAADHEIETDDMDPEQIADRIIGIWWKV
jgi:shikimate kinase